jgi:hypothetical protein
MWIAAQLTTIIVIKWRKSNTRSVVCARIMTQTIAVNQEKRTAKDQPPYRMIQLIKQAGEYFRLGEYQETGAVLARTSASDEAIASVRRA